MKTQAEAGAVTVSVTSVEPWADVADRLMPDFTLTADNAATKVLPVTQQAVTKTLDALGVQVAANLPTATRSVTETTDTNAAGEATRTRNEQQKEEAGKPPTDLGSELSRSLKDMTVGLADSLSYQQDPILQYQTASALYQEVQLLRSYLKAAALQSCFTPYLVRLQIGVVPYARRQPYDVYHRVSFFVGDEDGQATSRASSGSVDPCADRAGHLPRIVPLVVTDNLEVSREQQAQQVARQLGLALSGTVANAAVAGELNRLTESLNAIAGQSLNSVTSVTRVNDSTFLARFGAVNDASVLKVGRAMVPRNYNISVVVLVPDVEARKDGAWLSVLGRTELRDVSTGSIVDQDRRPEAVRMLRSMRARYGLEGWRTYDNDELYKAGEQLAHVVAANDYDDFCAITAGAFNVSPNLPNCLNYNPRGKVEEASSPAEQMFLSQASTFYNDFSGAVSVFEVSSAWLELPRIDEPALPPTQSAVLLDNGVDTATVRLWGGGGFTEQEVGAWLRVHVLKAPPGAKADQTTYDFTPIGIARRSDGSRILELRFPTLTGYGVKPEQISSIELVVGLVDDARYGRKRPSLDLDGVYCIPDPKDQGTEIRRQVSRYFQTFTVIGAEEPASEGECTARAYRVLVRTLVPKPAAPKEDSPKKT